MSAQTTVHLTAVSPRIGAMTCHLLGDATPTQTGAGAWTVVDRPRRKSFVEYTSVQLNQFALPLMIDGADDDINIEPLCAALDSWRYPTLQTGEPPVLEITGPIPQLWGTPRWVIQTIGWKDAIRDRGGNRTQQTFDLTVLEYVTPNLAVNSPAAAAQQRAENVAYLAGVDDPDQAPYIPPGGHQTYVVRWGDILPSIAAGMLGDYSRWAEIADLNDIRDPRSIRVGDVLILP